MTGLPEISELVFSRVGLQYNPDGISFALQFRVKKSDADIMSRNDDLKSFREQMFGDFEGLIASFITELYIIYET